MASTLFPRAVVDRKKKKKRRHTDKLLFLQVCASSCARENRSISRTKCKSNGCIERIRETHSYRVARNKRVVVPHCFHSFPMPTTWHCGRRCLFFSLLFFTHSRAFPFSSSILTITHVFYRVLTNTPGSRPRETGPLSRRK